MVRGQHQHHRLAVALQRPQAPRGDRSAGIARDRLKQDIGLDADFQQILRQQEAMRLRADDDRPRIEHRVAATQQRLLEQRMAGSKTKELFRLGCARQGPQAGAGSTAQDDGNDAQSVCSPGCIW